LIDRQKNIQDVTKASKPEAAEPEVPKKHPASLKRLNQSAQKCVRRRESILIARQKNSISTTRHLASLKAFGCFAKRMCKTPGKHFVVLCKECTKRVGSSLA
jgi:hypothetical protein